jgi:hypothetical protein
MPKQLSSFCIQHVCEGAVKRRDLIAAIGSTLIGGLPLDARSQPSIPILAVLVGESENTSTRYRNRFANGSKELGI